MVGVALALLSITGAGQTPRHSNSVADSRSIHHLFSSYWDDYLRENPEVATALGDKRYNDRWRDLSPAAVELSLRRDRRYERRLLAIDSARLSEEDKLSVELLKRMLSEEKESARFKEWEMPLNQIHGIHFELPQLISSTPFEDAHDYENYIKRLRKVPELFDQLRTVMSLGMKDGHMPARLVSEKVLAQVDSILAIGPDESPFLAPVKKFPESISAEAQKSYKQEIETAFSKDVVPAYKALATFLETQYIPRSRSEAGVWSIPDGNAYYAYCIQRNTTLKMSAEQIHQLGLDEVKRDEAAMLVIARNLGYNDLKSFNAAITANPQLHATSRERVLDAYRGYLNQMKAKLPEQFGTLPKSDLIVEATPSYTEKQRPPATYEPATADGKHPGRVVVNTYNYSQIPLWDAESIAYHEGIPGHHLQFSIAQEKNGLPAFRQHKEFTAYTEGWALYSEQLGKDVGFYQDPYSDYGRLEGDIWRAIRLVVDTGLHSRHWTRQQVVDYFHDHSSIDETNVQRETDRYIAWPGQALGYKIGQLNLLELRRRAESELGPKFDIKKFHDLILGSGALPLDILDQHVNDWIAAQK
jgi:uncharacterized protein (DUF885 family)